MLIYVLYVIMLIYVNLCQYVSVLIYYIVHTGFFHRNWWLPHQLRENLLNTTVNFYTIQQYAAKDVFMEHAQHQTTARVVKDFKGMIVDKVLIKY